MMETTDRYGDAIYIGDSVTDSDNDILELVEVLNNGVCLCYQIDTGEYVKRPRHELVSVGE